MNRRMPVFHQRGVTLLELVMVLVIAGLLAAIAVPRLSLTDAGVHAQAAQLARDIRHVQMLAMSQGRTLTFESLGGSYRCVDTAPTPAVITDPATQQPFSLTLDHGVTATAGSASFDSLGRPVNGGALLGGAVGFTVSGGGQSATLSISPVTGFVTVSP